MLNKSIKTNLSFHKNIILMITIILKFERDSMLADEYENFQVNERKILWNKIVGEECQINIFSNSDPYLWAEDIILLVKMAVLPKLIFRFNRISIKIFTGFFFFFREIGWLILKLLWKWKGLRIIITILKKNKAAEVLLSHFKAHYKATVGWCWPKDRHRLIE